VVVRLQGTRKIEAKALIASSQLDIISADELDNAAKRAVQVISIHLYCMYIYVCEIWIENSNRLWARFQRQGIRRLGFDSRHANKKKKSNLIPLPFFGHQTGQGCWNGSGSSLYKMVQPYI
jgi:hypothetical protein